MTRDYKNEAARIIAGVPLPPGKVDTGKALLFVEEILSVNEQLGLVSKKETGRVLAGLLGTSAAMWEFLERKHLGEIDRNRLRIIDIGSGAGFPGMVWKLMEPRAELTLVERKERKAAFLGKMVLVLKLDEVEVVAEDARAVARMEGRAGTYDVAVMTAVAPPLEAASLAGPLLGRGGVLLTLRGGGEKVFPGRMGEDFRIKTAETGSYGTFLLYEKIR